MAQNLSNDHINLTMLTDFYEITMANGYFTNGFKDTIGYFDMFSAECRTAADLPLWQAWSSSSIT